ncbi:hypothetical protein K469DRAFT_740277 [Zopfia rhizophila CBS 207.26]|uniref:Uncharacterized protein n=1 Tax=Zopfia rhizophila CBS 207.26 TaxID=1314779 RepID=A0A6A6DXB6_9PEZI|nr:hypothetical protein K469DRAFT_740277 [Zopfia rhizophila CBS 207.26]
MYFTPISRAIHPTLPRIPKSERSANIQNLIRDQFSLKTWLLLGAAAQSILLLLPLRPTYNIAPAFLLLTLQLVDSVLVTLGWKRNIMIDGTIGRRVSALQPDHKFDPKNPNFANGKIAVLHLGFRINHPLGILAPGARDIAAHFMAMMKELNKSASTNGFLGHESYHNTSRTSKSELLQVMYFRSLSDIDAFAHGPVHREGWNWWNATVKQHRHLGISHEVFEALRGKWENVYVNYHETGMGAMRWPVVDGEGKEGWVGGLVEAGRGALVTHKGRIAV